MASSNCATRGRSGFIELGSRDAQSARRTRPKLQCRYTNAIVCHAAAGDVEAALAELREAAGPGQIPAGWRALLARPELEALRGDSRLGNLAAAIRAEAARQRMRLANTPVSDSVAVRAAVIFAS